MWLSILIAVLAATLTIRLFHHPLLKKRITSRTTPLLLAGVVVLSFMAMYYYFTPRYLTYVFENKIKKEDPVFILLAQKDPLPFHQYLDKVRASFVNQQEQLVPYYTGQYIYGQLVKYSPQASAASFYNLAKTTLDLYSKTYAQNPSQVLTLEFNLQSASANDPSPAFNPITAVKEQILESALLHPQPALSQSEKDRAIAIIQNILMKLSLNYGNNVVMDTFQHPCDPALNQKIAAEIIMAFYQMILDRGKDDGGLVVKYIFNSAHL